MTPLIPPIPGTSQIPHLEEDTAALREWDDPMMEELESVRAETG